MLLQYHQVLDFVQQALPDMRVTRVRNLAWGILGILRVRDGHLTVSEMARAIGNRSKHWHKFKRMWRFVSNVKWAPAQYFGAILRFVLQRFRVEHDLPIIIDQSTVAGRWEVLWASIPFRRERMRV